MTPEERRAELASIRREVRFGADVEAAGVEFLLSLLDRAREVLTKVEWAGKTLGWDRRCPCCGNADLDRHDADCALSALLVDLGPTSAEAK